MSVPPLSHFLPATRLWFTQTFDQATPVQQAAWEAIAGGSHTLVVAPTGSGKTLAAFLHAIDALFRERSPDAAVAHEETTRVLYISPVKALAADVARNLQLPLAGVSACRQQQGEPAITLRCGIRSGDTPARER
ncbi:MULTISPECIES: DEAD/DEAH box helicase, partial [Pantoea]